MRSELTSLHVRATRVALLASAIVLACLVATADAKRGGVPAHDVAPAVSAPAPAVVPAPALATAQAAPPTLPPGLAKHGGAKKPKTNGRWAQAAPVPAAPSPQPAVAAPPALTPPSAASAQPAAAAVRVARRRSGASATPGRRTTTSRPARPRAPRTVVQAPVARRAPPAPRAATAAAPRRAPARGGARAPARKRSTPAPQRSVASRFQLPSVRDIIGGSPAVTRLVEVIPRFVWLILGGLALIAILLGAALAIYARRLRRTAARAQALAGLAATDPLTGLLNRRGFESQLGVELARAHRYGGTLAVVFGDLRSLKAINDSQGHEAGDRALKSVAEILGSQIREGDSCGRIGGDEFAVTLVNQEAKGAEAFCDRVRDRLGHAPGPGGEHNLELTMGVALFPGDGETAEQLVAAADRELYAQRGISVGD